ncbi:MAG: hypothetical protein HY823_01880 [Acidobacteria bacterium]|nr:hypothetical protein [Acidobacteriota bacterium]
MAIPVLKLNLAPPPTLWRQHHEVLGWLGLGLGLACLLLAGGFSAGKVLQARREGQRLVSISAKAQRVAREQAQVMDALRQIDAVERAPRYRLAERIFQERALPWSRLTAELERELVQDVRLKAIQRVRASDGTVLLKVRGEAKSRQAEAGFVEALQRNATFSQVVLEREGERQGGGIDFDAALPVSSAPPAFEPLPVPPPRKVDQFGKPLAKDAKILRKISGGRGSQGAGTPAARPGAFPAPLKPPAARIPGVARPAPAPAPEPQAQEQLGPVPGPFRPSPPPPPADRRLGPGSRPAPSGSPNGAPLPAAWNPRGGRP